ncbi:MAG: hypothetical protein AAFN77_13275 [Planctomycetota bacterium]
MATLSFACPKCNRKFDRVKPEMAGSKVRCKCGYVFRLGPKKEKPQTARSIKAKPAVAKPVAAKPVSAKPVSAKPIAAKPTAAKPVAAKPVVAKPIAAPSLPATTASDQVAAAPSASAASVAAKPVVDPLLETRPAGSKSVTARQPTHNPSADSTTEKQRPATQKAKARFRVEPEQAPANKLDSSGTDDVDRLIQSVSDVEDDNASDSFANFEDSGELDQLIAQSNDEVATPASVPPSIDDVDALIAPLASDARTNNPPSSVQSPTIEAQPIQDHSVDDLIGATASTSLNDDDEVLAPLIDDDDVLAPLVDDEEDVLAPLIPDDELAPIVDNAIEPEILDPIIEPVMQANSVQPTVIQPTVLTATPVVGSAVPVAPAAPAVPTTPGLGNADQSGLQPLVDPATGGLPYIPDPQGTAAATSNPYATSGPPITNNPYASPPSTTAASSKGARSKRSRSSGNPAAIIAPGVALIVVGAIGLIRNFVISIGLFAILGSNQVPQEIRDERVYNGAIMVAIGILVFALVMSVLALIGGICMTTRKGYSLAIAGAIAAVISVGYFSAIGIPLGTIVGIWAIVVLCLPGTRKAFD